MYTAEGVTPEQAQQAYARASGQAYGMTPPKTDEDPVQAELKELRTIKYKFTQLEDELKRTNVQLETAKGTISELEAKVIVSSGVSYAGRDEETFLALQRIQSNLQDEVEALERDGMMNRAEIRRLENLCKTHNVDVRLPGEVDQKVRDFAAAMGWAAITGGEGVQA